MSIKAPPPPPGRFCTGVAFTDQRTGENKSYEPACLRSCFIEPANRRVLLQTNLRLLSSQKTSSPGAQRRFSPSPHNASVMAWGAT